MKPRRASRPVTVGGVRLGGDAPIVVQGMTKSDTRDVDAVTAEIGRLVTAGCELVRLAAFDHDAVAALKRIRDRTPLPLIADVHFDYRLAIGAIEAGVDKLRLNPGNIGQPEHVRQVARHANAAGIPIRVGANAGSLPADIVVEHGNTGKALALAALRQIEVLEDCGCDQIVVSCKSFDIDALLDAYRELAANTSWPFHIGVTEAGPLRPGAIRSAVGIALLLNEGLGDTIRVSLTAPGEDEIRSAYDILAALGLRRDRPELVSCPTCGRCRVDLPAIVEQVSALLDNVHCPVRVAVMGCVVNGPGEAREADVGLAAGRDKGAIFVHGQICRTVAEHEMVAALMEEIQTLVANHDQGQA